MLCPTDMILFLKVTIRLGSNIKTDVNKYAAMTNNGRQLRIEGADKLEIRNGENMNISLAFTLSIVSSSFRRSDKSMFQRHVDQTSICIQVYLRW